MINRIASRIASGQIKWIIPDFEYEHGEYFENDVTKDEFAKRGIVFNEKSELDEFLRNGSLTEVSKEELMTRPDNLTLDDDEFEREIEDPEYRGSYESMEEELKSGESMTLPAPIVIDFGDVYYGFAGNRRTNLAFRNSVPLKVWLVEAR